MSEVRAVCSVLKVRGNSTTESDGEDAVGSIVAVVFVESKENQGAVGVEVGVFEQGSEEVLSPV